MMSEARAERHRREKSIQWAFKQTVHSSSEKSKKTKKENEKSVPVLRTQNQPATNEHRFKALVLFCCTHINKQVCCWKEIDEK
uniref:Uncharacterized protein n=1 Tax=Acrobeloides nanus TaxID=290746 RepID=A0A914BY60_9BILA